MITDNDLSYLNGVYNINLTKCSKITDQDLQYLCQNSSIIYK